MSALVALFVMAALTAVLAPIARRRLRREVRRSRLAELLRPMQQAIEELAVQIGTTLLPAVRSAAQAMSAFAAAWHGTGAAE